MLSMTYQKYINHGTSCFIPGKVIDECYKILRMISVTDTRNLRAHEILQELRDISSMAIEHFDEKIVPDIKKSRPDAGNLSISSIYDMLITKQNKPAVTNEDDPYFNMLITSPRAVQNFEGISFNLSRNASSASLLPREEGAVKSKSKLSSIVNLYKRQSKIIKNQSKQMGKLFKSLKQLKRRLDESEIKNRELTESIKQLKASAKPMPVDEPPVRKRRTATEILKKRLDQ
jgi:F-box protein 28